MIPAEYDNGILRFTVGREYPTIYYLIQAQ
jgi:hypothetical protein